MPSPEDAHLRPLSHHQFQSLCVLVPAARICGVGVDAKDLLRTRAPLDQILGLDMSACNGLLCPAATEEPSQTSIGCHSWQIGALQELTEPVELITMSISTLGNDVQSQGQFEVVGSGSLNAIICWVDYMHDCHQTSWPPASRPCCPHAWPEAVIILPQCLFLSSPCHRSPKYVAAWQHGEFHVHVLPSED